jgi:HEAT repeat protein
MNRADRFADASLAEPLLAALVDADYGCEPWAAMGCGELRLAEAVPALVAMLGHRDWMYRAEALVALARIGDRSAVPAIAPLLDHANYATRQDAAEALGRIGGDEALDALWDQLVHRRYIRIGHVASALSRFAPEIVPRLIDAAASPDADVRYWAVVALGSTGDDRVEPTLRRLMAEDTGATVFDGMVSVAAKKALRTLGRIRTAIAARGAVDGA